MWSDVERVDFSALNGAERRWWGRLIGSAANRKWQNGNIYTAMCYIEKTITPAKGWKIRSIRLPDFYGRPLFLCNKKPTFRWIDREKKNVWKIVAENLNEDSKKVSADKYKNCQYSIDSVVPSIGSLTMAVSNRGQYSLRQRVKGISVILHGMVYYLDVENWYLWFISSRNHNNQWSQTEGPTAKVVGSERNWKSMKPIDEKWEKKRNKKSNRSNKRFVVHINSGVIGFGYAISCKILDFNHFTSQFCHFCVFSLLLAIAFDVTVAVVVVVVFVHTFVRLVSIAPRFDILRGLV